MGRAEESRHLEDCIENYGMLSRLFRLEVDADLLNDLVDKIVVHAPDKSSGHRRQKIELVWNFIGEVNLPGDDQTVERQRKGRTA